MSTILILEKNIILSNHLKEILKNDDRLNIVTVCNNQDQAMKLIRQTQIDILILDHLQINGLLIMNFIKKVQPSIKVIGFSEAENKQLDQKIIKLGAQFCLSKYKTDQKLFVDIILNPHSKRVFQ